jgi:hypothetical protein
MVRATGSPLLVETRRVRSFDEAIFDETGDMAVLSMMVGSNDALEGRSANGVKHTANDRGGCSEIGQDNQENLGGPGGDPLGGEVTQDEPDQTGTGDG